MKSELLNGALWIDNKGEPIHAHGGAFLNITIGFIGMGKTDSGKHLFPVIKQKILKNLFSVTMS